MEKQQEELQRHRMAAQDQPLMMRQQAGPPLMPLSMPGPPSPPRLSRPRPSAPEETTLRPGNYLLACWDIESMWGATTPHGSIYQIGGYLPHGVTFIDSIVPEDCSDQEIMNSGHFVRQGTRLCFRVHGMRPVPCDDLPKAMEKFMQFLEKGCQSMRPQYDGVLLLSHIQENIPCLLKAVSKAGFTERFNKVVKGMGDMCSYLAKCHMKRLTEHAEGDKLDLSLDTVYKMALGVTAPQNFGTRSDKDAINVHRILETLLEQKPTYSNFYREFIHPMGSRVIKQMANFRTTREKVELFLPLQHFIAKELNQQQVELIVDGVYAPSAHEEDKYLSEPQLVAVAMCRMLVTSGFEFEQLLDLYTDRGIAELELTLRTTFLGKMAGQSRAVVDQTIRATRLVVAFFKTNGHMDLDELRKKAKEQTENDRDKKIVQERYRSLLASKETQKDYKELFKDFKKLYDYIRLRLKGKAMFPTKSAEEHKIMADMLINTLIQAKMTHQVLTFIYKSDKEKFSHRKNLRAYMTKVLEAHFNAHGPPDMSLATFIHLLIDFCGLNLSKSKKAEEDGKDPKEAAAQETPAETGALFSTAEELEAKRAALDRAIHRTLSSGALLADFNSRRFTLAALKMFLVNKFQALGVQGELVPATAEHFQRLVAFMGFNHFRLKELYDSSPGQLAANLIMNIEYKEDLLPKGFTVDSLVENVLEYFKNLESRKRQ